MAKQEQSNRSEAATEQPLWSDDLVIRQGSLKKAPKDEEVT